MVPISISVVLGFLALIATYLINTSATLQLSDSEVINSTIAIFACLGGLVSATFVVYSYMQTNKSFLLGLKPSLLIQVVTGDDDYSFINYSNTSNNEFTDLTMVINLKIGNREIDLSDLFKPKMSMAAHDVRHKQINTCELLKERGIDLNKEVNMGNNAVLTTAYSYTFNKKLEKRNGAEYKWNAENQRWELL